jgi:hypothetical protein
MPKEKPELEDHCEKDMFDFGSTKAADAEIAPAYSRKTANKVWNCILLDLACVLRIAHEPYIENIRVPNRSTLRATFGPIEYLLSVNAWLFSAGFPE